MFKSFLEETKWLLIISFFLLAVLGGNVYWFATHSVVEDNFRHAPNFEDPNKDVPPPLVWKQIGPHLYTLTGMIAVDDCERIVPEIPKDDHPFTVILESPGGSLADGACLAGHLKIRNVVTVVRNTPVINEDGEVLYTPGKIGLVGDPDPDGKVICASSCTLIFLAGDNRYLIGDVWIGIHGPKTPDTHIDTISKRALESSSYRTSAAIMMMLDQLGITDNAIKYMFVQIPATSMYWLNTKDWEYKPELKYLATHYKNFWGFTGVGDVGYEGTQHE